MATTEMGESCDCLELFNCYCHKYYFVVQQHVFGFIESEPTNQSQIDYMDIGKSKMAATEMGEFCD